MSNRIAVGIVGSGFIANMHVRSWQGVRDGDIVAIASTREESARKLASFCRELGVGHPAIYTDVTEMLRNPDVQAVWVTAPNHVRVPIVEAIVNEVRAGRSKVRAVAIEKPLARNVAEARKVLDLVESAGLLHGYLVVRPTSSFPGHDGSLTI